MKPEEALQIKADLYHVKGYADMINEWLLKNCAEDGLDPAAVYAGRIRDLGEKTLARIEKERNND